MKYYVVIDIHQQLCTIYTTKTNVSKHINLSISTITRRLKDKDRFSTVEHYIYSVDNITKANTGYACKHW